MDYATLQMLHFKCFSRCFYCGFDPRQATGKRERLSVEHKNPKSRGGTNEDQNLALSCRSCNSSKGTKTVEEFRAFCAMREFEKKTGVSFTSKQLAYLRSIGTSLDIPEYQFWYELFIAEILARPENEISMEKIEREENKHADLLILNGLCKTRDEAWSLMLDPRSPAMDIINGYERLHSW